MKKILLFIFLAGFIYGQDVDTTIYKYYSDSLNTSKDTLQITLQSAYRNAHNYFTVLAYAASGTDTAILQTQSWSGTWSTKAGIDMTDNSYDDSLIVTTVPKEFIIFDPDFRVMRLYSEDTSIDMIIEINGKKSNGF